VDKIMDSDGNTCSGDHYDAICNAQITHPVLQNISMAKIGAMIEAGTLAAFVAEKLEE
jgi:hypothetical protein